MNYGTITTYRHHRVVRNAWFGPETFVTVEGNPPHVQVDDLSEKDFRFYRRWYFPVEDQPWSLTKHFARWDRWPLAKAKVTLRNYTFDVLRYFVHIGAIHPCVNEGMAADLKDIRLGPRCYKWELDGP